MRLKLIKQSMVDTRLVNYQGVVWAPGPDGYFIPVGNVKRDKQLRVLRLQRTFGICMMFVMLASYIFDKWVW